MKLNVKGKNFRLFSPDENNSNRWQDVLEFTDRCYMAEIYPEDDHLSPDGRVMEVLSEHQCQGWLEGYLLTGRVGRGVQSVILDRSLLADENAPVNEGLLTHDAYVVIG